jgi:hypothetical protein
LGAKLADGLWRASKAELFEHQLDDLDDWIRDYYERMLLR